MSTVSKHQNSPTFTLKSGYGEGASENSSEASSPIYLDIPQGNDEGRKSQSLEDHLGATLLELRTKYLAEAQKVDRREYKPVHTFDLLQTSPKGDLVKGTVALHIPKCLSPKKSGGRCLKFSCKPCALLRSQQDVVKISNTLTTSPARYKVLVTLTNSPGDFGKASQKVRNLKRLLVAKGYELEFAWTLELTKAGVPHIHALALSNRYIPNDVLTATWGAQTNIRKIYNPYGAAKYLAKGARFNHPAHINLNSGKAFHYSSGFRGEGSTTKENAS